MYTIKIEHRDIGVTEYPVYRQEEADKEGIQYKHWQKCEKGDWALTDDNYVATVIKKKSYFDHQKRESFYYRMPFGYIMWNPKYPNKHFACGGRDSNTTFTGKPGIEVKNKSDRYQQLAYWASVHENRDIAIDKVFGPISQSKHRKLRRHMRTRSFIRMKREESQKLLADNLMDADYFVELMKEGIDIAKEKKDVNGIRGFVNDGMEIHGMKDKDRVVTTEKIEAVATRKLVDNINQEEEKLIATRKVEEPKEDEVKSK